MAISVVGSGSAAATSVTIPAHQIGDLILISARGTAAAPSVPSAGGTVPAWTTLQSGLANSVGLTTVGFVATATNHTSGTFTNATHICVIVLRGDAGSVLSIAAVRSSTGNGNNTQTIVYPALTFQDLDGSSWGVRFGTRGVADSEVANAPSGWTNRVVQPAGASALMAIHTRASITSSPTADSVSTAGTNSAYRAHTVEVQEIPSAQTVSVGGVNSGQNFGIAGLIVEVQGVPPPTYDLHLAGGFLSGQALVGWTGGDQFGDPTVGFAAGLVVSVNGVPSAKAFGSVTPKSTITKAVSGVGSAQSFGTIKANRAFTISGLGSAQAFGTLIVKANQIVAVAGCPSSQAFSSTTKFNQTIRVNGLQYIPVYHLVGQWLSGQKLVGWELGFGPLFGKITIQATITRSVSGVSSAQLFGVVRPANLIKPAGLGSAQQFGLPGFPLAGVPSAQQFGIPRFIRIYLTPSPPFPVLLDPSTSGSASLTPSTPSSLLLDPTTPGDGTGLLVPTEEEDQDLLVPTVSV